MLMYHPFLPYLTLSNLDIFQQHLQIKRGSLEQHNREFNEQHLHSELERKAKQEKVTLRIPNFDATNAYDKKFQMHGMKW